MATPRRFNRNSCLIFFCPHPDRRVGVYTYELDLPTLVWTRGRDMPLIALESQTQVSAVRVAGGLRFCSRRRTPSCTPAATPGSGMTGHSSKLATRSAAAKADRR